MIAEQNKTYVGKLRVRNSVDALSTRIRLDSAFSTLELRPSGLPKSAVVFIRKLRDPLPGVIPRDVTGGLPDAWRRAVAATVDELTRRAVRPALQDVGSDAESVLFLDRSELLACLASDWVHGCAITRWWWHSLFRATDVISAVVNEWLSSIEYVPAAFAKVTQRGDAVRFVSSLPAGIATKLLNDLIRQFGLYELSVVISLENRTARQRESGLADVAGLSVATSSGRLSAREVTLLQTRLSPEVFTAGLPEVPRLLLAVALMLERAPSLLRDRSFVSRLVGAFRQWDSRQGHEIRAADYSQGGIGPTIDLVCPETTNVSPQPRSKVSALNDGDGRVGAPVTTKEQRSGNPIHSESSSVWPREQYNLHHAGGLQPDLDTSPADFNNEGDFAPFTNSPGIAERDSSLTPETIDIRETQIAATTLQLAMETRLGGVFYLINVALALDLYGDFTRPLEPGIELSIWDFLALTARELIGEQIEPDPLWPLLAKLAGRNEHEQPGAGFDPPAEWRVPPDWLKAFPEVVSWHYQTSHDRLIVWHPSGFTVLDLEVGPRASTNDLKTRLTNETVCYPSYMTFKRLRRGSGRYYRGTTESKLDRWSRWLAEYLRVRLARSLGISPENDVATIILVRAARIEVSPARLDVFFKLDELPVEIRLAGLDRDPGWVPAAGRAITFHYD